MITLLSILYGLHITLFIYWVAYCTVKGMMGGGFVGAILAGGKFFVYWKLVTFGFSHLSAHGILIGLVGSIYLSFPVLYWINLRMNEPKIESRNELRKKLSESAGILPLVYESVDD